MSFFNFQPMNDIDRGREALKYFHNSSVGYSNYGLGFDEMLTRVSKGRPDIFLEGVGLAINSIGMSDSHVRDSMEGLAKQAQGRLPANNSVFYKALSDREGTLTFTDWVKVTPQAAANTALDLAKGAQQVGDAVLDAGKSLLTIGPLLVVGAVIFIVVMRSKQLAGA